MATRGKVRTARVYGGLSDAERRADRRSRLLDAGLHLFGTLGYPAVAIPDICTRAGVTARNFYEEFASRETLLKQLYDDIAEITLARVREATFSRPMSPEAVVRAGCTAFVEYMTLDPRRARIFSIEVAGVSRELDRHRLETRRRFASLSLESVERLRKLAFDPDVDLASVSTLLTGAADGLLSEWVLSNRPTVPVFVDTLSKVWMRALQIDHLPKRSA